MPAPINNTTNGLLSPFLGGNPKTGGTTTPLIGGSTITSTPNKSGVLASSGGALGNFAAAANGSLTSTPVTSNMNLSGLQKPDPATSSINGLMSPSTPSSQPSVYQQNLSKYGITSVPTGYSFGANGTLANGSGQEYQKPGNTQPATTPPASPTTTPTTPTGTGYTPSADNLDPYKSQAPTFPGLVGVLGNTASTSSPQFQAAENQYLSANKNLADLRTQGAIQGANIEGSRTNLAEAGGEQGLLQRLEAGKESALTGEMSAAQAAAQTATAQQGTQQSGLAAAGGLAYPVTASPYGVFSPTTNQFTGYGGANGGGATGAGIVQGQVQAGQTYAQNQAIIGKAQAQIPNLMSAIQKDNFNPSNVTYLNQLSQWAKGNLSDSSIPEVQGALNDIVGALSSVLGVPSSGGSDFRLQFAGSIVNALQSGQSIQDAVNFAVQQAVSGNKGYLQGAQGATPGSPAPGTYTANNNGDGTVSAGGYKFKQNAQGQWVAA